MKKIMLTALSGMVMALAVVVPESHSASPARMAWTRNTVQYTRGGRWVRAYRGLPLRSGAYVRTGSRSRAQIHYSDGTVMRLGSRSIARIRYIGRKNVRLRRGKAYFKVKKQRRRMRVRTRTAVATVLGTEFVVEVKDESSKQAKHPLADFGMGSDLPTLAQNDPGVSTQITTIEGSVGVSNLAGGGTVEVTAGMFTSVQGGQSPKEPRQAPPTDLNPEGLAADDDGPDGDLAKQGLDPSNPQQQNVIQQNSPGSQGSLDTSPVTGELEVIIR